MNADDARRLLERLLHGIAPEIDLAAVRSDELLQDVLDLDSIDFLSLVTAVHDETGLEVPERDYPELASIDGFVAYVASKTGG